METYTYRQTLPSCRLTAGTLTELEKRLCNGIPRLMKSELDRIMRGLKLTDYASLQKFSISIEERSAEQNLQHAWELQDNLFKPGTRRVVLSYRLAAPHLVQVEMVFADQERPYLEIITRSPQVHKLCPRIFDGLVGAIELYGNRYKLLHNFGVQALTMLSVPLLFGLYGYLDGIDPFFLYSSLGWLCLLAYATTTMLPRLFPWVSFANRQRLELERVPLLAMLSVNLVALACYITMVFYELPRTSTHLMLLAKLGG